MSKKKKNKNVTSIAIKLNSSFVRNLFYKFIVIDIAIVGALIVLWCIESEISFYGEFVKFAQRSFNFYPIETANYKVIWDDGKVLVKDAAPFLNLLLKAIEFVGILEGFMLISQILFGTAKNRRVLKPLNEMAEAASRLSDMALNEEKFQSLEDAISRISPDAYGERIRIGDSELQGLEEAINNLLDRMREANRQQLRFVSDASHELRTPISVIQGYANMLDRWGKDDPEVLEESITAIKTEAENMKNLVEQLLFLARGINGKTELKAAEFSLNDMMKELLEEYMMIDKDHIYTYAASENIIAYGDTALLKQAARILIDNAAKYTDKGEEIILRVGKSSNNEVFFSIQDHGIGIDEKDIPHIFERFFRADTARVRKDGGTGLGLSIAKWIVDSHKGYFSVLSRKEIGTRITVFLPSEQ